MVVVTEIFGVEMASPLEMVTVPAVPPKIALLPSSQAPSAPVAESVRHGEPAFAVVQFPPPPVPLVAPFESQYKSAAEPLAPKLRNMETAKVAVRKNGLDFGFMKADCDFSGVFEEWVTTGGDSEESTSVTAHEDGFLKRHGTTGLAVCWILKDFSRKCGGSHRFGIGKMPEY